MSHDEHHEHLVKELVDQLKPIFSHSPQGVYLYLDDMHKACNERFAKMLGYRSPEEWVANEYPISDLSEEDRNKGIKAYMDASQRLKVSTLSATWIKKDGRKIKTELTMVPLTYKGEVFVLHFISIVK